MFPEADKSDNPLADSRNPFQGSIQTSHSGTSKHRKSRPSVQAVLSFSKQSIRDLGDNDRMNPTVVAGYNVNNLIQGIGILGVPFAISKGSWVGIFLIFFTAFLASSTGKMLVNCLYSDKNLPHPRRIYKSYSDLGAAVWPRFGSSLVTAISLVEMFGGITLYIILLSVESQRFLSHFFADVNIYYCSLVLTSVALPFMFVQRMSIISWFSFIAVIGLMGTILSILAFCIYNYAVISIKHFPGVSWSTIPLSMGIITFSYCAHAAFPGIEGSMKFPESFNKMMSVSFVIAAVIKFILGFVFNLIFGVNTLQQCTLNVDNLEFSFVIEVFVILNTFFSLPLVMHIITERVDEIFQFRFHPAMWPGADLSWYWLLLSRGFILTLSMFTAMIVPHFALLMGLVGSVTGSFLTFIFPCLFSLQLEKYKLTLCQKMYRIFIIIIGIGFGLSGTVVSMMEIVDTF